MRIIKKRGLSNMPKRGISPIIATVLLLSFSIALGAIVLSFTERSTKDLSGRAEATINKEIQCSFDYSPKLLRINNNDFICYNRTGANNLELIVENEGSEMITGVQVMALDSNNVPVTRNLFTGITANNRTKYNLSLGEEFVFPPIKVLISPLVSETNDSIELCVNNRIDTEDICQCGTSGCV
jgi:flagellin-like protein